MREPEVGDLEAHQDSREKDATREVILFAHLCEIPPDDIRRMKLRNYARLQAGFSFYDLSADFIRQGTLALASHTGWSLTEILRLRASKFVWWIEGLPRGE